MPTRPCLLPSTLAWIVAVALWWGCEAPEQTTGSRPWVHAQVQQTSAALGTERHAGAGRVLVCHLTGDARQHTLVIAAAAVPAHLAHGDAVGNCPTACSDATACHDGNACTTDDCGTTGECTHVSVSCDDDNPCTVDECDPASGCTATAVTGVACDDGNDCTELDTCEDGSCHGVAVAGCCIEDADCSDDDGCTTDQCLGRTCSNLPIDCGHGEDACVATFCDPLTATCTSAPVTCDDGDPCSHDSCDPLLGCLHTEETCDDSDGCTNDTCDPALGCQHTPSPDCGTGGPCVAGMVPVDSFCMDQYEAALVEVHSDGSTSDWPADVDPGTRSVRAVSLAGVQPQAHISQFAASAACLEAGKRMCTDEEWLRACRGVSANTYPYGNTFIEGACNDGINAPTKELAETGAFAACVSEERAYDLVGNLNEWTADPAGTTRGGSYGDSQLNGVGCSYITSAFNVFHRDERTGFRCCSDLFF